MKELFGRQHTSLGQGLGMQQDGFREGGHGTPQRVRIVALFLTLLLVLRSTEDDLSRPTDSGYTRGCTTFGRQRSRIIAEAVSGRHPWLGLSNNNNDIVFTIGGVPCRFSNDDPSNPSKDAVLTANRYRLDFLEFAPCPHRPTAARRPTACCSTGSWGR